jgi:hypothetical protein
VFLIAWHGWPVSTITRRPLRLLAGNGLVIGLGIVTYLTLRDLAHWARTPSPPHADASSAPSSS